MAITNNKSQVPFVHGAQMLKRTKINKQHQSNVLNIYAMSKIFFKWHKM